MEVRYTAALLHKLEAIFAETDYHLRYEKGNFKAGYCVLKEVKVVIVNKYFPTEGKINCLMELLRNLDVDPDTLSPKSRQLFLQISQAPPTR
jgi:hypothetical protein